MFQSADRKADSTTVNKPQQYYTSGGNKMYRNYFGFYAKTLIDKFWFIV